MATVWCLNLDAELELEDLSGYRCSPRMLTEIGRRAAPLAEQILARQAGDVVLGVSSERDVRSVARDAIGVAWCPTPSALQQFATRGIRPAPAPDAAILRRVNHRAFVADLAGSLDGAQFVTTLEQLDAVTASPDQGRGWLLKRALGFSGRGRKLVPGGGVVAGAARLWAAASMDRHGGGLQVEPVVALDQEFAIHGLIEAPGDPPILGRPTVLQSDSSGGWVANRVVALGELASEESASLLRLATLSGEQLAEAGYFGPFGIDAFRWRDLGGSLRYRPCSELNARYTMGYWVGMR